MAATRCPYFSFTLSGSSVDRKVLRQCPCRGDREAGVVTTAGPGRSRKHLSALGLRREAGHGFRPTSMARNPTVLNQGADGKCQVVEQGWLTIGQEGQADPSRPTGRRYKAALQRLDEARDRDGRAVAVRSGDDLHADRQGLP